MKKPIFPFVLGLAAIVAVPMQAKAVDEQAAEMPIGEPDSSLSSTDASGVLSFEPPQSHLIASASPTLPNVEEAETAPASAQSASPARDDRPTPPNDAPQPSTPTEGDRLFEGGSESLVARTVGAAEGTRTAEGGKTQNYHGHVDPGNGVWNRGTFSYQFGNQENLTPDEADRRQLAKIQRIYEAVMLPQAEKHGVTPLTLAEEINGIDLINQAPLAVTESGGYIERLAQAKSEKGLTGDAAILEARVWAFWDEAKGGWDAPGLRAYDDISKEESIRRDQDRRMAMISKALERYEQQNEVAHTPDPAPAVAQRRSATKSESNEQPPAIAALPSEAKPTSPEQVADSIIFGLGGI